MDSPWFGVVIAISALAMLWTGLKRRSGEAIRWGETAQGPKLGPMSIVVCILTVAAFLGITLSSAVGHPTPKRIKDPILLGLMVLMVACGTVDWLRRPTK